MAEKKETPRQKMIGMMYLVLTALLALNVSKEVLQGFVTVNESLEKTNKTFNESTLTLMNYFGDYIKKYPAEKFYYDKAKFSEKYVGDMYNYIEALKKRLIEKTEKRTKEQADTSKLRYVAALDNLDVPTFELFGDDEANPFKGEFSAHELREKLKKTHDDLQNLFAGKDESKKFGKADIEAIRKKISAILPVDPPQSKDAEHEDWQMSQFYHLPLAAVVTNLSKIQSDLRNVESETVNTIAKSVMTNVPKINDFSAAVVAPSSYVQVGQKYTSDIFLATGNSDVKREIFIGDFDTTSKTFRGEAKQLPMDEKGHAIYEQTAGSQGESSYKGAIKLTKENGEVQWFPFEQKYTVAPASVAVSNDNMNVLYAGIDNPLSISAAGIAPQNLRVTSDNGTIVSTGGGKFMIKNVKSGKEVKINVSAQTADGMRNQGAVTMRIRNLPKPYLKFAGKGEEDKTISKAVAQNGEWITAQPQNFLMNMSYQVVNYTVTIVGGGTNPGVYQSTGGKITAEIKNHLRKVRGSAKIFVEASAKSPDDKTHSPTLILTVN